jgi:hypothetical protein
MDAIDDSDDGRYRQEGDRYVDAIDSNDLGHFPFF